MYDLLKIYGERNTNTNYLGRMLALNLDVQELPGVVPEYVHPIQQWMPGTEWVRDLYFSLTYKHNLGWKHSCVRSLDELQKVPIVQAGRVAFVTLTKNPYSWLLSLYRNPYNQRERKKPSFEQFLQSTWKTQRRSGLTGKLDSPIELWNLKNASYSSLTPLNALHLRTEETFIDPAAIVEKIQQHFSLRRLAPAFVDYERSTKDRSKDTNYYRDYYLNEKWRESLSDEAVAIINDHLDHSLVADFGYKLL